jgi:hypothetical protein
MPAVLCICQECGDHYYGKDELYIPINTRTSMRFTERKTELKTWQDWLIHISSHCENCRIKEIPVKCLENLNKIKGG